MIFHAVNVFIAIAQLHASTSSEPPELTPWTALRLLGATLDHGYSTPMATYVMVVILNLGTSRRMSRIEVDLFSYIHTYIHV